MWISYIHEEKISWKVHSKHAMKIWSYNKKKKEKEKKKSKLFLA
jgi:hypothetical protein